LQKPSPRLSTQKQGRNDAGRLMPVQRVHTQTGCEQRPGRTCGAAAGHGELAQLGRHRLLRLLQNLHQLLGHAAVCRGEEGVGGTCAMPEAGWRRMQRSAARRGPRTAHKCGATARLSRDAAGGSPVAPARPVRPMRCT
jgi:hypothetical protein